MDNDWTSEWTPPPSKLPELAPETLAAIRALQDGETEDSTRHLFETFEPQLMAYFKRHGCRDYEAQDLTQNVFLQMLEQIGMLKDATSFHFWLFRLAGNDLRDFRRGRARENERNEDWETRARKDREPTLFWTRGAAFEPNPEAKATVNETVDHRRLVLHKLFHATRLAPQTRQTLLLRLRGLSYTEIARGLGVSAGTVGSHLSRAGAALVRNLETIDLETIDLDDADDDELADLDPELLTFRGEAMAADPAYLQAAGLENGSAGFETDEESEEMPLDSLIEKALGGEVEDADRPDDSTAAIASVFRQERRRGRRRRRRTRAREIPPPRPRRIVLPRLSKDALGYPMILLGEAAARCNGDADRVADGDLVLQAKLTCAGSLLARGRRFPVARRAETLVREAIVLIGNGGRDAIHNKVEESRSLLRSTLGHN